MALSEMRQLARMLTHEEDADEEVGGDEAKRRAKTATLRTEEKALQLIRLAAAE